MNEVDIEICVGLIAAGDFVPLDWSTGVVCKRRIELWESSAIRRKKLSPSCVRLRCLSGKESDVSMRSEKTRLPNRPIIDGASNTVAWDGNN